MLLICLYDLGLFTMWVLMHTDLLLQNLMGKYQFGRSVADFVCSWNMYHALVILSNIWYNIKTQTEEIHYWPSPSSPRPFLLDPIQERLLDQEQDKHGVTCNYKIFTCVTKNTKDSRVDTYMLVVEFAKAALNTKVWKRVCISKAAAQDWKVDM